MIYQQIITLKDFDNRIQFGKTKESIHLDFKAMLNSDALEDVAIDIAAFANTYGGVLLIGVSEKTESGVTFAKGIVPNIEFEPIRQKLNGSVRNLIRPIVHFETVMIETSIGVVVAVNVEPSVNLVGVNLKGEQNCFCFPYRTEFGNRYFEFGEVERRMSETQNRANYLKMVKNAPVAGCTYEVDLYPIPKGGENVTWYVSVSEKSDHEFILQRNHGRQVQLPYSFIEEIWRPSTMTAEKKFAIRLKERLVTTEDLIDFRDPDMVEITAEKYRKFTEGMSRVLGGRR